MLNADRGRGSSLLGEPNFVAVERGIAEFRAGRPVAMTAGPDTIPHFAGRWHQRRAAFVVFAASAHRRFQSSFSRRAARVALGIEATGPVALPLPAAADAKSIYAIAASKRVCRRHSNRLPAEPAAIAALALAKLAFRLPALLAVKIKKAALSVFDPADRHHSCGCGRGIPRSRRRVAEDLGRGAGAAAWPESMRAS